MMVCEEGGEQTAPSLMPIIKPAVGGKSVGKQQRGCDSGLVQDCHLVVWQAQCRLRHAKGFVLCLFFFSVVLVWTK